MRYMCLAILAASALASSAQDSEKTFSFRENLVGTKQVLEELSKKAGVRLTAGKAVENDPLYLKVENATLQETMKRVAAACSAEWEKTSDGYRLIRSASLQDKHYRANLQAKTEAFRRAIPEFMKEHASDQKWDVQRVTQLVADERKRREDILKQASNPSDEPNTQTYVNISDSSQANPAGIALYGVIGRLNPSDLASIPANGRWVYSSQPTRMQKPLPIDANVIISSFVRAQNLLASVAGSDAQPQSNVHFTGGLDIDARPITGNVGRVLLICSRPSSSDDLAVQLKFFDGKGFLLGSAVKTLSANNTSGQQLSGIKTSAGSLRFSAESQEYLRLMASSAGGGGGRGGQNFSLAFGGNDGDFIQMDSGSMEQAKPISEGLLGKLAHPETTDPLGYFVAEALDQGIEGNIACCLPDSSLLELSRRATGDKVVLSALLEGLPGVEGLQADGWTVLSAVDPYVAETQRTDRAALGAFVRSALSKGYANLNDMAALAATLPLDYEARGMESVYLGVILPESTQALNQLLQRSRNMLALYGTLSADQKKLLAAGQTIAAGTFDRRQMSLANDLVFGSSANARGLVLGKGTSIGINKTTGDTPPRDARESLESEKTERLPSGILPSSPLSMQFLPKEAVYSRLAGGRDGRFLSAGEVGMRNAMAQRVGSDLPASVQLASYTKFRAATLTRMPWSLGLGEDLSVSGTLSDASIDPSSKESSLEEMSDEFKKAVQAGFDSMKNVKFNTMQFGGKPPPNS